MIAAPYVTHIAETVDFTTAAALPVSTLTDWHMLVNPEHAKAGDIVLANAAGVWAL